MPTRLDSMLIPAEVGRGIFVKKGQVLKIVAIEGPQVADITFINKYDHKDSYDACLSYMINSLNGTGDYYKMRYLYSRLPQANILMEITDDHVARHWVINGGHCSHKSVEFRRQTPSKRSCHGNVAEVIADFGMTLDEVPNTFPLWMYVKDKSNGDYEVLPSLAKENSYIDFLAHSDVLAVISACPGEDPEAYPNIPLNDGVNRALIAEIWTS